MEWRFAQNDNSQFFKPSPHIDMALLTSYHNKNVSSQVAGIFPSDGQHVNFVSAQIIRTYRPDYY